MPMAEEHDRLKIQRYIDQVTFKWRVMLKLGTEIIKSSKSMFVNVAATKCCFFAATKYCFYVLLTCAVEMNIMTWQKY